MLRGLNLVPFWSAPEYAIAQRYADSDSDMEKKKEQLDRKMAGI